MDAFGQDEDTNGIVWSRQLYEMATKNDMMKWKNWSEIKDGGRTSRSQWRVKTCWYQEDISVISSRKEINLNKKIKDCKK